MMARLARALVLIIGCLILTIPTVIQAQNFKIPDFQITIPGVTDSLTVGSETTDPTQCPQIATGEASSCYLFPWIGQYVSGLYTFAVYVSAVLAAVVIMVGGFLWLTAGGNPNQIGSAKTYIGGALLGFCLILGSYTILRLINPNLVMFSSLNIPIIKHVDLTPYTDAIAALNTPIFNCSTSTLSSNTGINPTLLTAFNEAGRDFGVNPSVLAGIAQAESSMGTDLVSSAGALGIMQITPDTADTIWRNAPTSTGVNRPRPACDDVHSDSCKQWMIAPANNTQVIRMGAFYYDWLGRQLEKCGQTSNNGLILAAYNSGQGNACNGNYKNFSETLNYIPRVQNNSNIFCNKSGGVPNASGGGNASPSLLLTAPSGN